MSLSTETLTPISNADFASEPDQEEGTTQLLEPSSQDTPTEEPTRSVTNDSLPQSGPDANLTTPTKPFQLRQTEITILIFPEPKPPLIPAIPGYPDLSLSEIDPKP